MSVRQSIQLIHQRQGVPRQGVVRIIVGQFLQGVGALGRRAEGFFSGVAFFHGSTLFHAPTLAHGDWGVIAQGKGNSA